jgi:hypothetical protein
MIPEAARQIINHNAFECLVLASLDPEKLNSATGELFRDYSIGNIVIGRDLSAFLMNQNRNNRGQLSENWLLDQVSSLPNEIALCWNIDLLFEPSLNLDPLMLFRQAGRRKSIIVLWPGSYSNNLLSYAVPAHRHYRTWTDPNARIYSVD